MRILRDTLSKIVQRSRTVHILIRRACNVRAQWIAKKGSRVHSTNRCKRREVKRPEIKEMRWRKCRSYREWSLEGLGKKKKKKNECILLLSGEADYIIAQLLQMTSAIFSYSISFLFICIKSSKNIRSLSLSDHNILKDLKVIRWIWNSLNITTNCRWISKFIRTWDICHRTNSRMTLSADGFFFIEQEWREECNGRLANVPSRTAPSPSSSFSTKEGFSTEQGSRPLTHLSTSIPR